MICLTSDCFGDVLRRAALVAVLALIPSACDGDDRQTVLEGPITHVRDGDTLEVNCQAVRLRGVTCDETGALARAATRRIRALTGAEAACRLNGERSADRLIGWCAVNGRISGRS